MTNYDKDNKEIHFIDRNNICSLIEKAYSEASKDSTYFKIICIYGIGGIGKSRILKENLKNMCIPKAKPIYITLEITHRDDLLDILIKFRKALPKKYFYPLFDYAMLILWNNLNVSQLNDEFLSFTKNNIVEFLKTAVDATLSPITGLSITSVIDLFLRSYNKLKKIYSCHQVNKILDNINNMQTYDLLQNLPLLLGKDIHRVFLDKSLIMVVDAFKNYSQSITDTASWLISIIQNIQYGLFIITSREKIILPEDLKKYTVCREISELPEKEVEKELLKQFKEYPELVENIITTTNCIPIYLDLAIQTVNKISEKRISKNQILFKEKKDIIHQFLAHLSEQEQKSIMVLSIVQIFDDLIFEHLVKDLNLQIEVLEYDTICNRTLIRNLENDNYFYKIHDIVCDNISIIANQFYRERVLKSYLSYIHLRGSKIYSDIQTNMLFKHILTLFIKFDITLSQEYNEALLDIFFVIKEANIPFDCFEIIGFEQNDNFKFLFNFIRAISEERANSSIRLQWLNGIDENLCCFGKHIKSLQLMKAYLRGLCEGAQYLKSTVTTINSSLTKVEVNEWYYGQAKIFFGDCYISYGQFTTGLSELQEYQKLLPNLVGKENHSFQVVRHIAHGYRFNMMLDKADELYSDLIYKKDTLATPLQKVYILTNLCETNCYFNPDKVISIQREALDLSNNLDDLKSKGKIYYSLAIVWIIKKKYKRAKKCIHKSLYFNQQDGYLAGKLYAHMANAYYEYSVAHNISKNTLHIIRHILEKIQVYSYFELPLSIMSEEYNKLPLIRNSYEWIDFDYTAIQYRLFLDSLTNLK